MLGAILVAIESAFRYADPARRTNINIIIINTSVNVFTEYFSFGHADDGFK